MTRSLPLLLCLLACLAAAVPAGAAARPRAVPILLYHHLAEPPAGVTNTTLWVRPARFRAQVAALARAGYRAVTLRRVLRAWRDGRSLPRRPVVLSFDDGYPEHHRVAAAALRRRGWPGVLNLQVERIGRRDGLSAARIRRMLRDGWELAAHSTTHPDLTRVDAARLRAEVAGSREELRRRFAAPVDVFCLPYGRTDAAVDAMIREAGYAAATTTRRGVARPSGDPYRLPRIIVPGRWSQNALLRALKAHR